MKSGYKRLLLFLAVLFIIVLLNTFIINFLSDYRIVVFLIILLFIFNKLFVIEKDKNMNIKNMLFEVFIFLIAFFILYYLLGLVVGLAKNSSHLNFNGIRDVLLPIILYSILREIFRFNMLSKAENNYICTILVVLLWILFDVTNTYYYTSFISQFDILRFVALALLPSVSKNIAYSYISRHIGYKPIIVFDLVFSLYGYIVPIVPNINEYVTSMVYILVPILLAFKFFYVFERKLNKKIESNYKKFKFKSLLATLLIVFTIIYFYSGYFRYYAVAIATGSMHPNIKKGDVVIIDQKYPYNKLKVGEVIAVRKNGVIIVHRIEKRIKIGDEYFYYTKGDANRHTDNYIIDKDMVMGLVNMKIPYIGYPTVMFNEK